MAVRKIKVPKTPKSAYNPERPISGLLRAQIAMLEEANLSFEPALSLKDRKPATEGQASRYIQYLHAKLRGHLKKKAEDQSALSPRELRAALAPRSSALPDGSKRWAATIGPSVDLRERKPPSTRSAKPSSAPKRARKRTAR
jgi:hypothetical protein